MSFLLGFVASMFLFMAQDLWWKEARLSKYILKNPFLSIVERVCAVLLMALALICIYVAIFKM